MDWESGVLGSLFTPEVLTPEQYYDERRDDSVMRPAAVETYEHARMRVQVSDISWRDCRYRYGNALGKNARDQVI